MEQKEQQKQPQLLNVSPRPFEPSAGEESPALLKLDHNDASDVPGKIKQEQTSQGSSNLLNLKLLETGEQTKYSRMTDDDFDEHEKEALEKQRQRANAAQNRYN